MNFETVTAVLSGTFYILALEKIFTLLVSKKNIYKKYGFEGNAVFGLALLDIFGASTIWIKYTLVGSLGVLTLFCLCAGAVHYNLKNKTFKDSFMPWIGVLCTLTIFLEYIVIK